MIGSEVLVEVTVDVVVWKGKTTDFVESYLEDCNWKTWFNGTTTLSDTLGIWSCGNIPEPELFPILAISEGKNLKLTHENI